MHNAGTAPSARLEDSDDAMLDEVLDLQVRAAFRLVRAALPGLRAAKAGTVVLAHGPAATLNWPPMTMKFLVQDKMLLDKLEAGKEVELQFVQESKDYVGTQVK